jgi:glycosyltransferase involved in cell wall biosynthesis
MRILQINTKDIGGGAEKVAFQFNNGLNEKGIHSDLLVGTKESDYKNIFNLQKGFFPRIYSRALRELLSLQGFFSYSTSKRVINMVNNYDIVHYHNLHGDYFNIKDVKRISNIKSAVWTLHDMWSFTGRCSYAYDCKAWQYNCGKCKDKLNNYPKMNFDNSRFVFNSKKKNFVNSNIHIVTPSKWLESLVRESFLNSLDIRTIYNGVDINIFKYNDKLDMRKKYNLNYNKKYILFLSADINDKRKGFKYLVNVLNKLKNKKDIVLLTAGKKIDMSYLDNNFEIHQFGYITSEKKLNEIYSLSDVFVMPTLADNFPCTIIECMSSGTPVISFDVGGINEQISSETGWLVKKGNEDELFRAMQYSLENMNKLKMFSINSRNSVVKNFSLDKCIREYINLYESIL